ncbi:hypothetical protein K505DRAFT_412719 [Melanomma pulvis-pyrius CBS 109.77]|uniref:Azaphilone pigments biosynthesis cluster protein L N-terminal domain-containing protein n=1 Tax=Melanomma pulvis-pyrius CBS 109.77 TaxID=1314802 RepID=A0A6A6XW88_9PLEO|nr:hypothetical protein K505DRAFT_412719 [Melanomma pulvis-pyrius CBS 109.77]
MSGLEIVASIAGVATAAIKISVSMNDVADELGSAGRDVRYISNEMACFSQVLRLVHSSLEDGTKVIGSSIVQSVLDTLPQLIEQCSMVYEEANGLMVSLKPSTTQSLSLSDSLPFFKRVRFIFQKSRIGVLRSLLDSSKSTLNLLLVTLNIEMAKTKSPNKELMDQLQSERKAFIRVVASQSRALNEALGEVEKAKKETTKLRGKAEKEKKDLEKAKQKEKEKEKLNSKDPEKPEVGAGATLQPPSLYMLPGPSVSQLVYSPPKFDSAPQSAVVSLALSLEPARSSSTDEALPTPGYPFPRSTPRYEFTDPKEAPTPPTSPHGTNPYGHYTAPPPFTTTEQAVPKPQPESNRPPFEKRIFTDPGPAKPETNGENLYPRGPFQERARSPYGFPPTAKEEPGKRKPSFSYQHPPKPGAPFTPYPTTDDKDKTQSPDTERGRKPHTYTYQPYQPPPTAEKSTPASPETKKERKTYTHQASTPPSTTNEGSTSSPRGKRPYTYQPPPPPPTADQGNATYPETTRERKPSYQAPPPPPPPQPPYTPFTYQSSPPPPQPPKTAPKSPPTEEQYTPYNTSTKSDNPPPPHRPSNNAPPPPNQQDYFQAQPPASPSPAPPPPQHSTTYIALTPYTSPSIGHLTLSPFDILVDASAYIPSPTALPYPTQYDASLSPVHYWQASLHHRRGPRGLFPHDVVCGIDDERVVERIKEGWFAGGAGMVADERGRVWIGPSWVFVEPRRRRSKWWAGEF